MSENQGEKTPVTAGERIGATLFLAILVFLPITGCLMSHLDRGSRYYGYGRRGDLQQIGKAIIAYTNCFGEYLPPTLWALYPQFIDDPGVLLSPADAGIEGADDMVAAQRYFYLFENASTMRGRLPDGAPLVIYPSFHSDGELTFNVLYNDGHVESRLGAQDLSATLNVLRRSQDE